MTELPLTQQVVRQLALEAAFRNVQIGELIGELIVGLLKEDLLQTTLAPKEPNEDKNGAVRKGPHGRPAVPVIRPGEGPCRGPTVGGRAGTKRNLAHRIF
jgi:hypothetical protein